MFESLQGSMPPNENWEYQGMPEGGEGDYNITSQNPLDAGELSDGETESQPQDFYANLAENMSEAKLNTLAAKLIQNIEDDLVSRSDWENSLKLAFKYLGLKIEEFKAGTLFKACAAYDSSMMTALYSAYAVAIAELFPASGPARSEILGSPNSETEQKGERVKLWMNYFLTILDDGYYPDSLQLVLYTLFFGCAFRKVYYDPILNMPCARLIKPQNLIVNNSCTSLMESDRITEIQYLNRRQVLLNQKSGFFLEFDLSNSSNYDNEDKSPIQQAISRVDGVNTDNSENKSLFKYYSTHTDLNSDDLGGNDFTDENDELDIPRPYLVYIDSATSKIVSIIRNWEENDPDFVRNKMFVQYSYMPGFGLYSNGIAHTMGSNSITLTTSLRQMVDAATFHNYPAGLKSKQVRAEDNDVCLSPGEFREVDTGERPISECFMNMPYNEPSQVTLALMESLKQDNLGKAASAQTQVPDIGANAPVGTTLALLEVNGKEQSTVLRSFHNSLGMELRLLFKLFGKYLPEEPYPFSVPGKETAIMRSDFNDSISIVPVSDPNVITTTHRLIQNEALIKLAQSAPELHDMREVLYRMYTSMNVENIDKILPPTPQPMPLDPITENMFLLSGKKVMASMFQDDASHIIVHDNFLQSPIMQSLLQSNPQAYAQVYSEVTIHSQTHAANQAFKEMQMMQQQQGMDVQPISQEQEQEIPLIPEIQNKVAADSAEKIIKEIQDLAAQQEVAQANQIDPNRVMVYEIEQRAEQAKVQAEIDLKELAFKEEEVKLKTETEAFKAQLRFESEKSKMEIQRDMAIEKNQVDLAIEHSRQQKHSDEIQKHQSTSESYND